MALSVLFSSFVSQVLVVKQLAELNEGYLRTSERSSYPLVNYSGLGWVLSCFWDPQTRIGPSEVLNGPPNLTFIVIFYFYFFFFVILGLSQKNSGPNPMSFQFLVGGTMYIPWVSMKVPPPPLGKSWLRHSQCIQRSTIEHNLQGRGNKGGGQWGQGACTSHSPSRVPRMLGHRHKTSTTRIPGRSVTACGVAK